MIQFKCPYCKGRLAIQSVRGNSPIKRGFKRQAWQEFHLDMGSEDAPVLAGTSFTRRQPARAASVESDVKVPFFQAMICGAIASLATLLGGVGLAAKQHWAWWIPPGAALTAFVAVMALAWASLLGAHRQLLWLVEEITGQDLDQDGETGQPREPEPFLVEWTDGQNRRQERHHWPVPEEQVREIAKAHLMQGANLSKREIAKHTSLSEEKALEVLAFMRNKAYARYMDGNRTELTGRGEYFFSQLLST